MSKGTTTTSGLVQTYFANIFGPEQYQDLHEPLAKEYFQAFFDQRHLCRPDAHPPGPVRQEHTGPEASARALLELLKRL